MSPGGLSKARLGRLHDVVTGYVERAEVPGLVALVSRRGEVHVEVAGTMASSTDRPAPPMGRDSIFRISSMTGQPFEAFLRERIFEPLAMVDTGFHVPPDRLDRLVTSYWTDPDTGQVEVYDEPAGPHATRPMSCSIS